MPAEDFQDLLMMSRKKSKIVIDTTGEIYIENYGSLRKFTPEIIAFRNAVQEIEICGTDLLIESIEHDCTWICGTVQTLTLKERSL